MPRIFASIFDQRCGGFFGKKMQALVSGLRTVWNQIGTFELAKIQEFLNSGVTRTILPVHNSIFSFCERRKYVAGMA